MGCSAGRRARLVAEGWTLGERQGAVIATRYWFSLDNRCHLTWLRLLIGLSPTSSCMTKACAKSQRSGSDKRYPHRHSLEGVFQRRYTVQTAHHFTRKKTERPISPEQLFSTTSTYFKRFNTSALHTIEIAHFEVNTSILDFTHWHSQSIPSPTSSKRLHLLLKPRQIMRTSFIQMRQRRRQSGAQGLYPQPICQNHTLSFRPHYGGDCLCPHNKPVQRSVLGWLDRPCEAVFIHQIIISSIENQHLSWKHHSSVCTHLTFVAKVRISSQRSRIG